MNSLIMIPTYNEVENIYKLVEKIQETICNKYKYSILIIDDNSTDGTKEEILKIQNTFSNILSIHRPEKSGIASAYREGIKQGIELGYDAFIELDADFSHNPKYLPTMFELLEDNDVVIGSRNIKGGCVVGWSLFRNIISKGGSLYSKTILNCPINDLTGGFNGWKKHIIEKINLDTIISKEFSFQIEMKYKAYKNNAKIKEFPIVFENRKYGKSKMNKAIFFEALLNIIKIRFNSLFIRCHLAN